MVLNTVRFSTAVVPNAPPRLFLDIASIVVDNTWSGVFLNTISAACAPVKIDPAQSSVIVPEEYI